MRFNPTDDFYGDLKIDLTNRKPHDVPVDEIRSAWKKLIIQYHPDKLKGLPEAERLAGEEMAKRVNAAKTVLLDENNRASFHLHLSRYKDFASGSRHAGSGYGSSQSSTHQTGGAHSTGNRAHDDFMRKWQAEREAMRREAEAQAQASAAAQARARAEAAEATRAAEERFRQAQENMRRGGSGGGGRTPPPSGGSYTPHSGGSVGRSYSRYSPSYSSSAVESEMHLGKVGVVVGLVLAAVGVSYAVYRLQKAEQKQPNDWAKRVAKPAIPAQIAPAR